MGTYDYGSVVRRCYECFNLRDFDELDKLCATDATATHVCMGAAGTIGLRESFEMWVRGFPDAEVEITSLTTQNSRVCVEYLARGTHTGPLEGPMGRLPPSGKRAVLRLADVIECRDGKVAATRCYWDSATLLGQIGVSPERSYRGVERRPEGARPVA